jgi:hypothetical protein
MAAPLGVEPSNPSVLLGRVLVLDAGADDWGDDVLPLLVPLTLVGSSVPLLLVLFAIRVLLLVTVAFAAVIEVELRTVELGAAVVEVLLTVRILVEVELLLEVVTVCVNVDVVLAETSKRPLAAKIGRTVVNFISGS